MKKLILLLLVTFVFIIAGCGQRSEYEGKWITISKPGVWGVSEITRMEIKKNGENYIITKSIEGYDYNIESMSDPNAISYWKAKPQAPISGVLKDGKLMTDPFNGLTFIKADSTILAPLGEKYKKETSEELDQMKKEVVQSFKAKHPNSKIAD